MCTLNSIIKVKMRFFKTVARLVITCGSECWALNKRVKIKMRVIEMRILRWTCSVIKLDRIRNKY